MQKLMKYYSKNIKTKQSQFHSVPGFSKHTFKTLPSIMDKMGRKSKTTFGSSTQGLASKFSISSRSLFNSAFVVSLFSLTNLKQY